MSRVTFKFPEEMVEQHKPRKEAMGVSWPEYFDGQAPDADYATTEEVRQIVREECSSSGGNVSNEDLSNRLNALEEKLDKLPF